MTLEIYHSLNDISREDWQKITPVTFPFASYDFLNALETSGCLGARTGWQPFYLTARDARGLVGALVIYAKGNSYGEYIFDFAWAQAHETSGVDYYPKLVAAVPFTPATGPKLLFAEALLAPERSELAQQFLALVAKISAQVQSSSDHFLFITESETEYFQGQDYFLRHSFQFHWKNSDFKSFEDFLKSLKGKRRREILRERGQVAVTGLNIARLTGKDLTADHAKIMYQFYLSTIDKMSGINYLTLDFFNKIFATMSDKILLVLATTQEGLPVAGALNFFGRDTLFGRHWGCLEDYRSLHFELCYYQGIEFAIEKNFRLFEAGAQGEHKFQRGFLPSLTYSAHRIHNPKMDVAIRNHVEYEKGQLRALFTEYLEHTPFSAEA
jgi:predicted N-acyltransferase